MKKRLVLLAAALMLQSGPAIANELSPSALIDVKEGDVIELRLRQMHPTQPSVGFDQVYYKLGRFEKDREKLFDEICENNGQKGVRRFSGSSDIGDPASFACLEPVGSRKNEMKTVVIAPDARPYLTDGHHTFNVYWHMAGGGPDFAAYVVVARDYRHLPSMDAFWQQMEADGNVWLLDAEGMAISTTDLPASLGLEHFGNDRYRSLMYFTRGIAWHKPERLTNPATGEPYASIPFVEFYWSREVRKEVDLAAFDLTKRRGYLAAIRAVGDVILKLQTQDVGGSGRNVKEMGQYGYFNRQELARIDRPDRGKLTYMLAYKSKAASGSPNR